MEIYEDPDAENEPSRDDSKLTNHVKIKGGQ